MVEQPDQETLAARAERSRRFFAAVKRGDEPAVAELLRDDPKLITKREDGYAAIHYAVAYKCRSVVRLLLKHQCNLSVKDPSGRTPATIAVEVADDPRLGAVLRELQYRRTQTFEYRMIDYAAKRMVESHQNLSRATILALSKASSAPGASPWAKPPKK